MTIAYERKISYRKEKYMYTKFEKLLKKNKVTAYRVSKETGIPTATLTAWKHGKYTPKADKLLKIANYFNVPLETLLK